MTIIQLKSSSGEVFYVDEKIAKRSGTIKNMLEDLNMDGEDVVVPLPTITSFILRKFIEWSTHHKDDPVSVNFVEDEENEDGAVSSWDTDFLNVHYVILLDLILAANYLDVSDLMDAACQTIADMIKGKTAAEIRKTFDIKNDDGLGL